MGVKVQKPRDFHENILPGLGSQGWILHGMSQEKNHPPEKFTHMTNELAKSFRIFNRKYIIIIRNPQMVDLPASHVIFGGVIFSLGIQSPYVRWWERGV